MSNAVVLDKKLPDEKSSRSAKGGQSYAAYRRTKKWRQTRKIHLLRLPLEVRLKIYEFVFASVTMVDKRRLEQREYRRRHGAQRLLFVNKQIYTEAAEVFFHKCLFEVRHFRFHSNHQFMEPISTLNRVVNLTILWTQPRRSEVTTKRIETNMILGLECLRSLSIDFREIKRLHLFDSMNHTSPHMKVLEEVAKTFSDLPKWIRLLVARAPKDLTIMFRIYFWGTAYTWTESTWTESIPVERATILCNSEKEMRIIKVEPADTELCGRLGNVEAKLLMLNGVEGDQRFGKVRVSKVTMKKAKKHDARKSRGKDLERDLEKMALKREPSSTIRPSHIMI